MPHHGSVEMRDELTHFNGLGPAIHFWGIRPDDSMQPEDQFAAQIEFWFSDKTADTYETLLQLTKSRRSITGQLVPAHLIGVIMCGKLFKDFVGAHYTVQSITKISGWKLVRGRDGTYSLQRAPSPTDRPH